jgi:hypothetical protein
LLVRRVKRFFNPKVSEDDDDENALETFKELFDPELALELVVALSLKLTEERCDRSFPRLMRRGLDGGSGATDCKSSELAME